MAIYVHLADGFETIEALTIVDLLRRAEIEIETVSVTGSLKVCSAQGVEVIADILFEDAVYDNCDMIVLPGGGGGATTLAAHDELMDKIYSFANMGKKISAICASPSVVLGPAGILDGLKACCYPTMEGGMKGAKVSMDDVVVSENIITSRGPATSIPFALAIIESLRGKEAADKIAEDILYK